MCPYYPGVCKRALSQKKKDHHGHIFFYEKKKGATTEANRGTFYVHELF